MTPPDKPKRRRWLWITLGLILGCVLLCVVAGVVLVNSDAGADIQTAVSDYQTEEADN